MKHLKQQSVDQLYDYLMEDTKSLLEEALNCLELLGSYCKRYPDKASTALAVAETVKMMFDTHDKRREQFMIQKDLWETSGYLTKKLQQGDERKKILGHIEDNDKFREKLKQTKKDLGL